MTGVNWSTTIICSLMVPCDLISLRPFTPFPLISQTIGPSAPEETFDICLRTCPVLLGSWDIMPWLIIWRVYYLVWCRFWWLLLGAGCIGLVRLGGLSASAIDWSTMWSGIRRLSSTLLVGHVKDLGSSELAFSDLWSPKVFDKILDGGRVIDALSYFGRWSSLFIMFLIWA